MKNIFSLILILALASSLTAQTQKGNFMLGSSTNIFGGFGGSTPSQATIGFGKEKMEAGGAEDSYKYTVINFSPNVGYCAADGFLIGVNFGVLNFNTNAEFFGADFDITITTITPMLRYYFKNAAKTQPFAELRGGFISFSSGGDSESATILGAKAGVAAFLNEKVSLDFFLDYSSTFDKEDGEKYAQNAFGFGIGFNFFL